MASIVTFVQYFGFGIGRVRRRSRRASYFEPHPVSGAGVERSYRAQERAVGVVLISWLENFRARLIAVVARFGLQAGPNSLHNALEQTLLFPRGVSGMYRANWLLLGLSLLCSIGMIASAVLLNGNPLGDWAESLLVIAALTTATFAGQLQLTGKKGQSVPDF